MNPVWLVTCLSPKLRQKNNLIKDQHTKCQVLDFPIFVLFSTLCRKCSLRVMDRINPWFAQRETVHPEFVPDFARLLSEELPV